MVSGLPDDLQALLGQLDRELAALYGERLRLVCGSYYFRIRVEPEVEREVTGGGGGACGFPGRVQPVN